MFWLHERRKTQIVFSWCDSLSMRIRKFSTCNKISKFMIVVRQDNSIFAPFDKGWWNRFDVTLSDDVILKSLAISTSVLFDDRSEFDLNTSCSSPSGHSIVGYTIVFTIFDHIMECESTFVKDSSVAGKSGELEVRYDDWMVKMWCSPCFDRTSMQISVWEIHWHYSAEISWLHPYWLCTVVTDYAWKSNIQSCSAVTRDELPVMIWHEYCPETTSWIILNHTLNFRVTVDEGWRGLTRVPWLFCPCPKVRRMQRAEFAHPSRGGA